MEKNNGNFLRIDWILNSELAIGKVPRNIKHLKQLKAAGISSILSLCDVQEYPIPNEIRNLFKHQRVVLPDHRSERFPTIDELTEALNALDELKTFGAVYVHCIAAIERSPLVCMAWLVKNKNISPDQALDYLMSKHPGTSPLPGQLNLLKDKRFSAN